MCQMQSLLWGVMGRRGSVWQIWTQKIVPTTGIFAILTADKLSDIFRVKIKNLLRSAILKVTVSQWKPWSTVKAKMALSNSCSFQVLDHFRHIFRERQFQIFAAANLSAFPQLLWSMRPQNHTASETCCSKKSCHGRDTETPVWLTRHAWGCRPGETFVLPFQKMMATLKVSNSHTEGRRFYCLQ